MSIAPSLPPLVTWRSPRVSVTLCSHVPLFVIMPVMLHEEPTPYLQGLKPHLTNHVCRDPLSK